MPSPANVPGGWVAKSLLEGAPSTTLLPGGTDGQLGTTADMRAYRLGLTTGRRCAARAFALAAGLVWLVLAVALPAGPARAATMAGGTRIALVIGNSAYASVGRLSNPGNDATLVARSLKANGFRLIGGDAELDLDKAHFDRAVAEFGRAIAGADVALFYYSGHGLQVDGINFLVPVDANPSRRQDLDFQMVSADLVLRQMSGSGTKLNILILDACRNNPFAETGLRSAGGGLAEMKAPEGTLISYATQPGSVARDGVGRDSPYTVALVDAIREPGLGLFSLFNRVGVAVQETTGGAQQPWFSASPIKGEFTFAPPLPEPAPVASAPVVTAPAAPAPAATPVPDTASAETKKLGGAMASGHATAAVAAPDKLASLETPSRPPALVAPAAPVAPAVPERPASFHCPPRDSFVFGEDEVFDWNDSTVSVRRATSSWSWRSVGADPANPNMCLRADNTGLVVPRLFGWFDMQTFEFANDPQPAMLALLQGQATEASVRFSNRRKPANGIIVVFDQHWRLRGHESFSLGGRAYDTLVFDQSESTSSNSAFAAGRVWYAPALGRFVRRIWRTANSADVTGFTVVEVSAAGGTTVQSAQ